MTEELIIDGQHVDLTSTGITLDLVSGMFADLGKISLCHSYTVTIPATEHNRRIFDDPGNPAHKSSKTRRYLSARYFLNGIDLLGPAQACVQNTTPEGYEVFLLFRFADKLRDWSEANPSIQSLKLPTIQWVRDDLADYATSSTDREVFIPYYDSGVEYTPASKVGVATNPVISLRKVLLAATDGVLWHIGDKAVEALRDTVLLASTRKPNLTMELTSGDTAGTVTAYDDIGINWDAHGWDACVVERYGNDEITVGSSGKLGLIINLTPPEGYTVGPDEPVVIDINGTGIKNYYFSKDANGVERCFANVVLDAAEGERVYIRFNGGTATKAITYSPYVASLPAFALYNPHEHIVLEQQNLFPIAPNLPDLKCVDFVKATCALLGLVAFVNRRGLLEIATYDELLDKSTAVDWSARISGQLSEVTPTKDGLGRTSLIKYKHYESEYDLDARNLRMTVDDDTLDAEKVLADLPFGASPRSEAILYKVTDVLNEETMEYDYTVEDLSVEPRVFGWYEQEDGTRRLSFDDYLSGDVLLSKYYSGYQAAILRPTVVKANIRLTEADIATLDLQRPVYLAQTGQYYSILKVRFTPGELGEVEMIQI